MTGVKSLAQFNADGRMRGSYVYALTCWKSDAKFFFAAIGHTTSPIERMTNLRSQSPLPQHEVAFMYAPSIGWARQIAAAICEALREWRFAGVWFRIDANRRLEYDKRILGVRERLLNDKVQLNIQIVSVRALREFHREKRSIARKLWNAGPA
jgi:hypothetical protein